MSVEGRFEGFVSGAAAVTLPAQLFVELLPQIGDEGELRVTLYALYAIARKRGPLRAVRASELAAEAPLVRALSAYGGADAVAAALARAAARGTLLAYPLAGGDALYLVHNEAGRRALTRLRAGALAAPGASKAPAARPVIVDASTRPAAAYEQEIGVLGPAVAEALTRAEERYPEQWIVDAIQVAAMRNARSWRYVEAVLERWEAEGRDDATAGATAARTAGRERPFDHGPYEKVVRRS